MGTREYLSEIEVEVKFIYPLVKFLGYSSDEFNLRKNVALKMGSQEAVGEVDWVLWDRGGAEGERKPHVIIEAKAATRALDESVVAQARSYAFALGAPYYLVTNGRELVLYRRGVEKDESVVAINPSNITHKLECSRKHNWALASSQDEPFRDIGNKRA